MTPTMHDRIRRLLMAEYAGTGLYTDAQIDQAALRVVRDYEAPKGLSVYGRISWRMERGKDLLAAMRDEARQR